MKKSGITREIDELGRLVILKEVRDSLGISKGDPIDMIVEDGKVILQRSPYICLFCKEDKELVEFKKRRICKKCLEELKNLG